MALTLIWTCVVLLISELIIIIGTDLALGISLTRDELSHVARKITLLLKKCSKTAAKRGRSDSMQNIWGMF